MLTYTVKTVLALIFIALPVHAEQPCDVLNRVVVTGASVTAGYGVSTPPIKGDLGAYTINMKHIMEGLITSDHEEVAVYGDLMFFNNSKKNARAYIEKIKLYKPTLVVGVDLLFWFGHGTPPKDCDVPAYRMEKLNYALHLLDELSVPMVIGNLPNVRDAIGGYLSTSHIPTEKTLQKLNERIDAWADAHENVSIIDVHCLWNKALRDEEIVLQHHTWPIGSREKLLQEDMLHTTLEGTVAASLLVIEALGIECLETNLERIKKNAAAFARSEDKTEL